MNNHARNLARQYASTLHQFLRSPQESLLEQAYELGREAIGQGLGVLRMARIHQQALASKLSRPLGAKQRTRALKGAETFFMQALSPFEARHRGFGEANLRLRQLNEALQHRDAELTVTNRNLREVSKHLLRVQEDERKRLSRELHDEVGQALTAININLSLLRGTPHADARELDKALADSQALLEQTMHNVHNFARELRPAMLDELGLMPVLRASVRAFTERTGLRVRFSGGAGAEQLNDEQKLVLFRVAQESLTNVAKHAQASQVNLMLRRRNGSFQMQISDNGKAFAVDEQLSANRKKRLGLLGMQERAHLVNGQLTVESAPGKGTTVRIVIPIQNSARSVSHHG